MKNKNGTVSKAQITKIWQSHMQHWHYIQIPFSSQQNHQSNFSQLITIIDMMKWKPWYKNTEDKVSTNMIGDHHGHVSDVAEKVWCMCKILGILT